MKSTIVPAAVLAAVVLAATAYGAYQLGLSRGTQTSAPAAATATGVSEGGEHATRRHIAAGLKAGDIDPANGKRVLYYHDPMVPGKRFEAPGKSPFMDMLLVPRYAGDGGDADAGSVAVSPRLQQSLGVRSAEATLSTLQPRVDVVGSVAWNERLLVALQARASGFVDKQHVRATLDRVAAGEPIAELYVPDWVAAQEEYLALRRMQRKGVAADLAPLLDAAKARMRQAGMDEAQIALVERSDSLQPRTTLRAPIGGVVTELLLREGMTVMAGAPLVRINGNASVWVNAEVPESQAGLVRPGATVQARTPLTGEQLLRGKVQALLPGVDPTTRTVKARIELPNPQGLLTPGLFVTLALGASETRQVLTVPSEALIRTGKRTLVMLDEGEGRYRPVEVETGVEAEGRTEIRRGLVAGQKVVVSGQFLIDSEASLRAIEARGAQADPKSAEHQGSGRVEAVAGDAVTLSHGPIPSLRWDSMTMEFLPPEGGVPPDVKPGAQVNFAFRMGDDGPRLTHIHPQGGAR